MLSTSFTSHLPPCPRTHSTVRTKKLLFDGCVIVVTYE
jgi:hypothetical protein